MELQDLQKLQNLFDGMSQQFNKAMQEQTKTLKRHFVKMPSKSWRESRFTVLPGVVLDIPFLDTDPNYVVITNYSDTNTMTVGIMGNLSATLFDYKVPPKTRLQWVWGRGLDHLYVMGDGIINVQSYEADFDPAAITPYNYI